MVFGGEEEKEETFFGQNYTSVSELIILFESRDLEVLGQGLSKLLKQIEEGSSTPSATTIQPFINYLSNEPKLPHLFVLLERLTHEKFVVEVASSLFWLLAYAMHLQRTRQEDMQAVASETARQIITDHLRTLYRALSSESPLLLASAMDLLAELTQIGPTMLKFLIDMIDFSHKGVRGAAKRRANISGMIIGGIHKGSIVRSTSARKAYIKFIVGILKMANFECLQALEKHTFLLHYIIEEFMRDEPEEIIAVLDCVLYKLIFNERHMRNLPVAFLRGTQLSSIARLLSHADERVGKYCRFFLLRACTSPNSGLVFRCKEYTHEVHDSITNGINRANELRNKLIYDMVCSLDPINNPTHHDLVLPIFAALPDVACAFLSSGKVNLEPESSSRFLLMVAFVMRIAQILPSSCSPLPTVFNRAVLSRGILSSRDPLVQFYSLVLLLAAFRIGGHHPTLLASLPDFRTVFNVLHQYRHRDLPTALALLKVLERYLDYASMVTNGYSPEGDPASLLKVQHIWGDEKHNKGTMMEGLIEGALTAAKHLDVIVLLQGEQEGLESLSKLLERALQLERTREAARNLLIAWLDDSKICTDPLLAETLFIGERVVSCKVLLEAIREIHQKPLIFAPNTIPLVEWLKRGNLPLPRMKAQEMPQMDCLIKEEMIMERVIDPMRTFKLALFQQPSNRPDPAIQSLALREAQDGPALLTRLFDFMGRGEILRALGRTSPDVMPTLVHSTEQLIFLLLHQLDCTAWLRFLANLLLPLDTTVDLRMLVDRGLLAFAIVALSLREEGLRRCGHLILNRFVTLLIEGASFEESSQISLVLQSLANLRPPEEALEPLCRLTAFIYAAALPVLLNPKHALYQPLNELLLSTPTLTITNLFHRLFLDANNLRSRQLTWLLGVVEVAVGEEGEFLGECWQLLTLLHLPENVAILLLCDTLDPTLLQTALALLHKLARQPEAPSWMRPWQAALGPRVASFGGIASWPMQKGEVDVNERVAVRESHR